MRTGTAVGLVAILLLVVLGCGGDDGGGTGPSNDVTDPTIGSFAVGGGEAYTISRSVTLNVAASDNSGSSGMAGTWLASARSAH